MNTCIKCDVEMDDYRLHLGYKECTDCSEEEKYSAHTVYPHKTGGYVQPVTKTACLLYTSPSPRDRQKSRMPSSA